MVLIGKISIVLTLVLVGAGVINSGSMFLWAAFGGLLLAGLGGMAVAAVGSLLGIVVLAVLTLFV